MGLWSRLFNKRSDVSGKPGRVLSFDREADRGIIALDDGEQVAFETHACMFTPFVGLAVRVEQTDATGQAQRVRLADSANAEYLERLHDQAVTDQQAAARANQQRRDALRERTARRVVHPEIEARIERDPDDREAYQVYADLLQELGDPLGDLIAVECALEKSTDAQKTTSLREQARTLQQREEERLGFDRSQLRLSWRRGLIEAARLGINWQEGDPMDGEIDDELVATLLGAPAARFLRRLTIGLLSDEPDAGSLLELLGDVEPILSLRELFIGDFEFPDEMELSWYELGVVPSLGPIFPGLQRLILQAGQMELNPIDLPQLEHFELRTGGLSQANMVRIAEAGWPRLRSLVVWFGDDNYGAECTIDDVGPILAGRGLDKLTTLGICNADFTNAFCERLAEAKILPQLEVLDLSKGTLTDEGASLIVEHARQFSKLQRLDVSENLLTDVGIGALQALGCEVDTTDMRYPDDDAYYVAVGE